MQVSQLWRYPVKSIRGERLDTVELTGAGSRGTGSCTSPAPCGPLTGRTRHGLACAAVSNGVISAAGRLAGP